LSASSSRKRCAGPRSCNRPEWRARSDCGATAQASPRPHAEEHRSVRQRHAFAQIQHAAMRLEA
jgi:hypothetical protein